MTRGRGVAVWNVWWLWGGSLALGLLMGAAKSTGASPQSSKGRAPSSSLAAFCPSPHCGATTPHLVAASAARAQRQVPQSLAQWQERRSSTLLYNIMPTPDNFFTMIGFSLGITMTLYRNVNRGVQERAAWERRLEEGQGMEETDLEFLRRQAKVAYSEYGDDAAQRNRPSPAERQRAAEWKERRTAATTIPRMTPDEIQQFERDYGIRYDPYYDEPYEEAELPDDVPYIVDKGSYGDVRYESGEVFYRDVKTGLYYRQGAKPRMRNVGIFYFPI